MAVLLFRFTICLLLIIFIVYSTFVIFSRLTLVFISLLHYLYISYNRQTSEWKPKSRNEDVSDGEISSSSEPSLSNGYRHDDSLSEFAIFVFWQFRHGQIDLQIIRLRFLPSSRPISTHPDTRQVTQHQLWHALKTWFLPFPFLLHMTTCRRQVLRETMNSVNGRTRMMRKTQGCKAWGRSVRVRPHFYAWEGNMKKFPHTNFSKLCHK